MKLGRTDLQYAEPEGLIDPTEPEITEWDNPKGLRRGVGITNMINCTKVYAMAAYDVCTKTRAELGLK